MWINVLKDIRVVGIESVDDYLQEYAIIMSVLMIVL